MSHTTRSTTAARCLAGSARTGAQTASSRGSGASREATSGASPTGTARRARARCASIALRRAMVSTQARRSEPGRRRGYARSAAMKVSWKQSSASFGPTAPTRKRWTSSRWVSRKRWNGGRLTSEKRRARRGREIGGSGTAGRRRRGADHSTPPSARPSAPDARSGLRYGAPVTALQYDRRPEGLRSPVVLSAFRGWNDAGQAASAALSFIGASLGAERFAVIDPEEVFDFPGHRPPIRLGAEPADRITWPEALISEARASRAPHALVLIAGTEPSMRWRTFCRLLLDVASEVDPTMLVSLGSLLADVPHTRPVTITGIASDPGLIEGMGFREPTYEGPTGIVGVLHAAAMVEGLPAV